MKKLGLFGVFGILLIIVAAAVVAGRMGETSHAYARGTVVLADELKERAKGINTLFIVATGPDRPMPIGAMKKTLNGELTGEIYSFVLTKDNMQRMMGETPWPEQFKLKARLDQDGMGGMDQPGDLTGEVYPVRLGQEGVEIRINQVVP